MKSVNCWWPGIQQLLWSIDEVGLITSDNDTELYLSSERPTTTLKLSTAADQVGCAFLSVCSQRDKDGDFFQSSRRNYSHVWITYHLAITKDLPSYAVETDYASQHQTQQIMLVKEIF